ncbi:MAG: HAD-IB family phosphatase [Candidatus Spechtbacterales bacterium]
MAEKGGQKKFAVFDIDGTFFRSSLLIELVENLIEEGYFPKSARNHYREDLLLWLDRRGDYDTYIMKVVDVYLEHIKGHALEEIMEVADRTLLFHKNRTYRYTRDLIAQIKDTHFLLAISHSPYHIVEPFARHWGFQKVYAQIYAVDKDERFTGEVEYRDLILRKDKVLKRAIEKERLTLRGSVGVGDTESDAAFLKMVEKPIAFNPNSGLYRIAKRNHWRVVVERKDVIYNVM